MECTSDKISTCTWSNVHVVSLQNDQAMLEEEKLLLEEEKLLLEERVRELTLQLEKAQVINFYMYM